MVGTDVYQEEPIGNNNNKKKNVDLQDLDDEAGETLSLCDLPIYGGAFGSSDDYSKDDYQSSSDDYQNEFFEFFSEDFAAKATCSADNIIFCGKLIPYKESKISDEIDPMLQSGTTKKRCYSKKKSWFRWKLKSFSRSKTSRAGEAKRQVIDTKRSKSSKVQQVSKSKSSALKNLNKFPYANEKCAKKLGFSVKEVSILTSPTKARRNFFMFGLARFPIEMEMKDIRSRLQRRTPSASMFRSFVGDGNGEVMKTKRSRGQGLWRLLKILRCRSQQANAVVKASFGSCIPRVREFD